MKVESIRVFPSCEVKHAASSPTAFASVNDLNTSLPAVDRWIKAK